MTIGVSLFFEVVKKKKLKLSIWPQNNVQENLAMKGTEAHDRKDSYLRYIILKVVVIYVTALDSMTETRQLKAHVYYCYYYYFSTWKDRTRTIHH